MNWLFFWRRKRQDAAPDPFAVQPATIAPPAATTPAAPDPPVRPPQPPAMRQVYALALEDDRALEVPAPDPGHMKLLLAASATIAKIGTESKYTPRRPSMLAQLLEALSDEDASLRALSRIVAQDLQLTGNLLRTANSALYRVSTVPVESVDRAAALLGTTGIRTLLAASLMQPLATGTASGLGRFGETIWEHALFSASAAEAWASRSQQADPFIAHLVALMHGLGSVAVYRVLEDMYAAQPGLQRDAAVISDSLDTNAAVTAARIAANWHLSGRTQQALESQSSAAPVVEASPLAQALKFGLLTGAMTMLCKRGRLKEAAALERIEASGLAGPGTARIWDRMLRAYVRA